MKVSNQDILHGLNQQARLFAIKINACLKGHGLFAAQWSILFCLKQYGAMTQAEISRYLHVEAPTVTRTLVKMEQNGWIVRRLGTDKRERIIALTAMASDKYPLIEKDVREIENYILGEFSIDEKNQFYHLLSKMKY